MSQSRALLVGIDQYSDPQHNLNSCVNDTLTFRDSLLNTYHFQAADITLVQNNYATLDRIRSELDKLFTNVVAGDEIVFFQSSHGTRYPNGHEMVEALCPYDAPSGNFLEDKELVGRSQTVPAGVFTCVVDACHSGGLDKLFIAPQGPTVAPAKVWRPAPQQAAENIAILQQVTQFKFFCRAGTREPGSVAKQFGAPQKNLVAAKTGDGDLELNGVLLAACMADQTAAAGSPPTNFRSAFTYALFDQLRPGMSFEDLRTRIQNKLDDLNMNQTPVLEAPTRYPQFKVEAFITMQPATSSGGGVTPTPTPTPTAGWDPSALENFLNSLQS
jgi:hypothetical protein